MQKKVNGLRCLQVVMLFAQNYNYPTQMLWELNEFIYKLSSPQLVNYT